jgi:hypothetical protein
VDVPCIMARFAIHGPGSLQECLNGRCALQGGAWPGALRSAPVLAPERIALQLVRVLFDRVLKDGRARSARSDRRPCVGQLDKKDPSGVWGGQDQMARTLIPARSEGSFHS